MTAAPEQARLRIKEIRAERSSRALLGLLGSIGVFQLLYVCFAIGYWMGPSRLPEREVLVGVSGALAIGVVIAVLTHRRRLERGAKWLGTLREGRQARRIALFDEYITVDREILMPSVVERAELDGESLRIRYVDPIAEGPVLREFSGARSDLAQVAGALKMSEAPAA